MNAHNFFQIMPLLYVILFATVIISLIKNIRNQATSIISCIAIASGIIMVLFFYGFTDDLDDEFLPMCWGVIFAGIILGILGIMLILKNRTTEKNQKKCPKCNSLLKYNPNTQSIQCEFCGYKLEDTVLQKQTSDNNNDMNGNQYRLTIVREKQFSYLILL